MPKLPVGMHKRKGREGYWLRLYCGGRERRVWLATDYNAALEKALPQMSQPFVPPVRPFSAQTAIKVPPPAATTRRSGAPG